MNEKLIKQLDLKEYFKELSSFLAREKSLLLEGDISLHLEKINELSTYDIKPPPSLANLDEALKLLSKEGILHLELSYNFIKIILYFKYLKNYPFKKALYNWLLKINIPLALQELCLLFDEKGEIKEEQDERLVNINQSLRLKNIELNDELKKLIRSRHLSQFLIDEQIHFVNESFCLLLRGGSNIRGKIIARSSKGGFFINPLNAAKIQDELANLEQKKEEIFYEYAKKISSIFSKELGFLSFINKSFDLFDNLYARVLMAKKHDFEFIKSEGKKDIILKDFAHFALKNPKKISINFNKKILLITGVNAGGKSMLLKSILSAAFLAKYLFPMKIKASSSKIANFKDFDAILEDPQDVRNDISTFSGRMAHFARLFTKKDLLLAVDEIELGTDAFEAACLYSVLINKLATKDMKIVITTHHKKLAALLSKNEEVQLLAALYDEEKASPSFSFLEGTIGKSYAFETALKYLNPSLISEAKKLYKEDELELEELLNKNIALELELRKQLDKTKLKKQSLKELITSIKSQKEDFLKKYDEKSKSLDYEFYKAIKEAKNIIKLKDRKDQQRALNKANELRKNIKIIKEEKTQSFKVGDRVSFLKIKGEIIKLNKDEALIKSDNISLRAPIKLLKASKQSVKTQERIKIEPLKSLDFKLDLHGQRVDDAIELTHDFLSNALRAGLDEVIIYHGIGTGALSKAVKELLLAHPKVKSFSDAPLKMGGYGAKIVKL